MDYSQSSKNYIGKSCSSRVNDCSEESGWTMYLEDFDNDFHVKDGSFFASDYENSSVVSDAACSAIRDLSNNNLRKSHMEKRTKATLVDQELEDTASSPSHSPKQVCDLNHLYVNSKLLDSRDVCQAYNSNYFRNQQTYEHSTGFSQKKGNSSQQEGGIIEMDCMETQLRRKGLCLVPTSMLLDYLS